MRQQVAVLVNRAALHRHAVPHGGDRALEPRRAIDDEELGPPLPRRMRSSSTARQASALSPPMALTASSTFWPSVRTPTATKSEIAVALRSSRTHPVPSRISRTIGSSASARAFQASLRSSPCARRGSPCPCRPRRRTGRRARGGHDAVGAGEIAAGDQRVGSECSPLISPQRAALPLRLSLPSAAFSLARGTAISIGPKVPVSNVSGSRGDGPSHRLPLRHRPSGCARSAVGPRRRRARRGSVLR